MDEAQQVQIDRLAIHAFELVGRVVLNQRGVVPDALGGQLEAHQDALGQGKQDPQLLAALDFSEQLSVAEIPRLALDGGDLVQALVVGEEAIQRAGILRADQSLERPGQALALERQRPAHQVLKDGVAGQDDPLAAQQVDQLAQHVDRAAGDARGLAGVGFEHDPLVEGAEAVAK